MGTYYWITEVQLKQISALVGIGDKDDEMVQSLLKEIMKNQKTTKNVRSDEIKNKKWDNRGNRQKKWRGI